MEREFTEEQKKKLWDFYLEYLSEWIRTSDYERWYGDSPLSYSDWLEDMELDIDNIIE